MDQNRRSRIWCVGSEKLDRRTLIKEPARRMPGRCFLLLAGVQGLEPRYYGPEPHVLPLDDTPAEPRKGTGIIATAGLPSTIVHSAPASASPSASVPEPRSFRIPNSISDRAGRQRTGALLPVPPRKRIVAAAIDDGRGRGRGHGRGPYASRIHRHMSLSFGLEPCMRIPTR